MEQIHWFVAMRSKELWLVQGNHVTVILESNVAWLGKENLQRKTNRAAKSTNLIQNARKGRSVFCHQHACEPEKPGCFSWILQEFKRTLGKIAVAINMDPMETIRFELWMKGTLVTVAFYLCSWGHFQAAIQTAASCSELYLAGCCALKRTATFSSESKVVCLF